MTADDAQAVRTTSCPNWRPTTRSPRSRSRRSRRRATSTCPALPRPNEVTAYRPAILDIVERYKSGIKPLSERDTYGKAFLQIGNLWTDNEAVRRFVFSRRFAKIAADLMGVDGVRLYHDQACSRSRAAGRLRGTRIRATGRWTPTRRSRSGCHWWMCRPSRAR